MKPKREIRRVKSKSERLKSNPLHCYPIEIMIKAGKIEILSITEGFFLEGCRLGKWGNMTEMFNLLNLCGLKYTRQSYYLFRAGSHTYIPNPFLSALAFCVGIPVSVAADIGRPSALSIALRHPDRWVIPSYVLDRGSVGV